MKSELRITNHESRGFTLIELLVVIGIIILIASMSLVYLPNLMRGEGLKQGGQLIDGLFRQARQLASNKRQMHFLVFYPDKGMIRMYEDTDMDNTFAKAKDKPVGDAVILPKGVEFVTGTDGPPLFRLPEPWLGFRSGGSIMLPTGISDLALANPPTEDSADIVLKQKGRSSKLLIDFVTFSGIIRAMVPREE